MVAALILASLVASSAAFAAPSPAQRCRAKIHKITGNFVRCLLNAEAGLVKNGKRDRYERKIARCADAYEKRYDRAQERWPAACPTLGESQEAAQERVGTSVRDFADNVTLLVSGTPPSPQPGTVTVFNNCSLPVKLMSPTNPSIDGMVLDSLGTKVLDLTQDFNPNAPNTILVAPQTTTDQCSSLQCSNWTDISYEPPPPNAATNTKQREGAMWEAPNSLFAAYCQPTNAAADQCTADSSTPCCGPNMNFDKTFGTTWELSPFSSMGNDFIDLSTNYGTGPTSPPQLCGPGVDPDDCVTASANIFYNVPIAIEMGGSVCSCGSLGSRSSISCTQVSCTDAFQHPTDNKQCACSSGGDRGYVITYCPAGSALPSLPTMQ